MQGWKSECGKKVKRQKYLKSLDVYCVKFWGGECDWLRHAFDNKKKRKKRMQGWNSECGKKVKKQKYLKYEYVCCVKFW
jgi:hypothetical protein